MAEDFSTYTKVDPNGRLFVDKHQITYTGLMSNETAYVYKDYGASYFSGNYSFNVDVILTATANGAVVGVWGLGNALNDIKSIRNASGDQHLVTWYQSGTSTYQLSLEETVGGTPRDASYNAVVNKPYYLTIRRDVSVGTYGTIYCDIYSDAARTSLITTLSLALTAAKSFRYAYGLQSFNYAAALAMSGSAGNLSVSTVSTPGEDFSTYTKVDPNNRFTVDKHRVDFRGLARNESAYVYKDYGAGYFAGNYSFDVDLDWTVSGTNGTESGLVIVWGLSNTLGNMQAVHTALGYEHCIFIYQYPIGTFNLYLREEAAGSQYSSTQALALNTPYYLRLRRDTSVGTYGTLYCDIYSDAARTVLITTLSLALHSSQSFRYAYAVQSFNDGQTMTGTGYIGNQSDGVAASGGGGGGSGSGISRSRQVMG